MFKFLTGLAIGWFACLFVSRISNTKTTVIKWFGKNW